MTKLRLLAALWICFAALPADAAWERVTADLPREPVRALTAADGGLVVVGPRLASVAEAGGVRRMFTLASQTDALVGFAASGAAWYLASRRALWRSDDRGYSWQKMAALAPRDTNVILAVGAENGAPYVATTAGLRRPAPAGFEPFGALGRVTITAAVGTAGDVLATTGRGLFIAGAEPRRVALAGRTEPGAFVAEADGVWLAVATGVLHCAPACRSIAALTEVRDLAHTSAGYFAAATDGVYRLAAVPVALGGGLDGAPTALAAAGDQLYAATPQGLYRLVADAPAPAPAPDEAPADAFVAEPSIGEVRRMVFAAHPFLRDETAGWRSRARWRAAAPRVGVSVGRSIDEKSGLTRGDTIALSTTENRLLIGPNGESTSRSSGRALDYGLTLTWEFEELVFNPLEINVSNELEDLFRLRESLVIDVTRVYFDRLRVRRQLAAESDPRKRGDLVLRLGELTAQLDFYTAGRFTAEAAPEAP